MKMIREKIVKLKNCQKGVSLIEMLITTVLMSLALSSFYMLTTQTFRIWTKSESRAEVQQTAQISIEEMVREIRAATNNENYPVIIYRNSTTAPTSHKASVRFFYSTSGDEYEFIRYRFSDETNEIIRDTLISGMRPLDWQWTEGATMYWTDPQVMAEGITNLSFTPQTATFTGESGEDRNIMLEVQTTKSANQKNEVMTLRTSIELRNF